ncbi:MAG: tetratricopeptide repeat protein [Gemmatimonas sp.]
MTPRVADSVEQCVAVLSAQEAGRIEDAVAGFAVALAGSPNTLDLRIMLAYAQAAACNRPASRETLEATPNVEVLSRDSARRLADVSCEMHADGVALRAIDRALQFGAHDADLHANRGAVLHRLGRLHAARAVLDSAAAHWPTHVPTLLNRGRLDAECGDTARALDAYDAVLRMQPDHSRARSYRGLVRLSRGDHGGWLDYEARRALPCHAVGAPPGVPAWKGGDARGLTLLLWGEHGLGDQIMLVRFARELDARGARVVVRCDRSLVSMLRTAPGVHGVVSHDDALPASDAHVPMFSVPALLGIHDDGALGDTPYLHVCDGKSPGAGYAPVASACPERTRSVGIVWAGCAAHGNDHNRSFPESLLAQLLDVHGMQWTSFQLGPRRSELAALPADIRARVTDASDGLREFRDTARLLSDCDALVTVDTSVAHLAGALGVPTLIMLPYVADWRWRAERADSPWYRSVRLVRQREAGDWPSVVVQVRELLAAAESAVHRQGMPA